MNIGRKQISPKDFDSIWKTIEREFTKLSTYSLCNSVLVYNSVYDICTCINSKYDEKLYWRIGDFLYSQARTHRTIIMQAIGNTKKNTCVSNNRNNTYVSNITNPYSNYASNPSLTPNTCINNESNPNYASNPSLTLNTCINNESNPNDNPNNKHNPSLTLNTCINNESNHNNTLNIPHYHAQNILQSFSLQFSIFKRNVLSISQMCSFLNETLTSSNTARKIEDFAFLLWERCVIQHIDLAFLVNLLIICIETPTYIRNILCCFKCIVPDIQNPLMYYKEVYEQRVILFITSKYIKSNEGLGGKGDVNNRVIGVEGVNTSTNNQQGVNDRSTGVEGVNNSNTNLHTNNTPLITYLTYVYNTFKYERSRRHLLFLEESYNELDNSLEKILIIKEEVFIKEEIQRVLNKVNMIGGLEGVNDSTSNSTDKQQGLSNSIDKQQGLSNSTSNITEKQHPLNISTDKQHPFNTTTTHNTNTLLTLYNILSFISPYSLSLLLTSYKHHIINLLKINIKNIFKIENTLLFFNTLYNTYSSCISVIMYGMKDDSDCKEVFINEFKKYINLYGSDLSRVSNLYTIDNMDRIDKLYSNNNTDTIDNNTNPSPNPNTCINNTNPNPNTCINNTNPNNNNNTPLSHRFSLYTHHTLKHSVSFSTDISKLLTLLPLINNKEEFCSSYLYFYSKRLLSYTCDYNKEEGILNRIRDVIGDEVYRKGIRMYKDIRDSIVFNTCNGKGELESYRSSSYNSNITDNTNPNTCINNTNLSPNPNTCINNTNPSPNPNTCINNTNPSPNPNTCINNTNSTTLNSTAPYFLSILTNCIWPFTYNTLLPDYTCMLKDDMKKWLENMKIKYKNKFPKRKLLFMGDIGYVECIVVSDKEYRVRMSVYEYLLVEVLVEKGSIEISEYYSSGSRHTDNSSRCINNNDPNLNPNPNRCINTNDPNPNNTNTYISVVDNLLTHNLIVIRDGVIYLNNKFKSDKEKIKLKKLNVGLNKGKGIGKDNGKEKDKKDLSVYCQCVVVTVMKREKRIRVECLKEKVVGVVGCERGKVEEAISVLVDKGVIEKYGEECIYVV